MIGGATGKIENARKEKKGKKRNPLANTTAPPAPAPFVPPPITRISPV